MNPRDVLKSAWKLVWNMLTLRAPIESYVILTIAKAGSFLVGLGLGWWLWC